MDITGRAKHPSIPCRNSLLPLVSHYPTFPKPLSHCCNPYLYPFLSLSITHTNTLYLLKMIVRYVSSFTTSLRLKRVILIGDHHQLPPVIKNMAFQKYSNMEQSLFTRFIRLGMRKNSTRIII